MGISGENSLYWATGIDNSGLVSGTNRSKQLLSGLSGHAQGEADKMNAMYKRLGAAMAAYLSFGAAKGFVEDIVRVRGEFQQLDIALKTMLGSKREADKMMADIIDISIKTPFTLMDVAQNTKQLMAMGIGSEKVIETLKTLGDVASGVAVPLQRLAINYGQVATLGVLQGREVRDFAMAGVPIIEELAKILGVAKSEVQELVTAGEVGFPLVEQAFKNMSSEGGQFANLMEKQMGTVTGRISNLKDAFDRMLNSIGEANQGTIVGVIDLLGDAVTNYEEIIDVVKVVAATYGTYRAVLLLTAIAQKAVMIGEQVKTYIQLSRAIGITATNQFALNRAMLVNPYIAAAAGIAAIVGALVLWNSKKSDSTRLSKDFIDELKKETKAVDDNFNTLKKTAEGTDARKKAIQDINTQYKIYLPNLLNEKSTLDEIKDAQDEVTKSIAKSIAMKAKDVDLEEIRERVVKQGERASSAASTFAFKVELDNESKGKFYADFDKLLESFEGRTKVSSDEIGKSIRDLMRSYGVEVGTFFNDKNLASGSVINELAYSVWDYVNARIKEAKTIKDLDEVYNSYLDSLGLLNTAESKKNQNANKDEGLGFDTEAYEKTLDDKLKAYDTYENEVRQLGKAFANKRNSELLKEGSNYEEFLRGQLEEFERNTAAKAAIAAAAAKGNVNLIVDPTTKLEGKGIGSININDSLEVNSKTLKSMDEYKKRYAEILNTLNKSIKEESQEKLVNGLFDAGYAMQDLAGFASKFNQELAESLNHIAGLVDGVGNVVAGYYSGNTGQMISGAIGIASSLYSIFDNSAQKQQIAADKAAAILDTIKLQNIALERQLRLTQDLAGVERQESEQKTLELIQQQADELNKMADGSQLKLKKGKNDKFQVDIFGGVEDLEKALSDLRNVTNLDGYHGEDIIMKAVAHVAMLSGDIKSFVDDGWTITNLDQLQTYIDEYYALMAQRRELIAAIIDSSEDTLTDSLMDGFKNGLSAAQAFADTFEDAMKRAILASFETSYILPIAKKMMDGVFDAQTKAQADAAKYTEGSEKYNSTYSDSLKKYTSDFRDSMQGEISSAQDGLVAMKELVQDLGFGDLFGGEEAKGLAGALKSEMTEETGSMLAGLFNVISIDVRNIYILLQENVSVQAGRMQESVILLNEIEINTRSTAENTEELTEIKLLLKDIKTQGSTNTATR